MYRLSLLVVTVLLWMDADVLRVFPLRPGSAEPGEFPAGQSLPVLPDLGPARGQQPAAKKASQLQPESRLEIVRYVSGEFARALKPVPAGKKGFRIKAGQPIDEKALRQAVANRGPAVNTGDTVQITRLEFRDKEIVIDLNGGGQGRKRWRDRIQVQIGAGPIPTVTRTDPNAAPGYVSVGATLFLDFGRPLPDMTPDELKQLLSAVLDFSKQRSPVVQWVETLSPEFQKAIQEKRAIVGMDREMVTAALGKPEHKVRERDPDGTETEEWIYGEPPGKTIFVKFAGDKVVRVKEFP